MTEEFELQLENEFAFMKRNKTEGERFASLVTKIISNGVSKKGPPLNTIDLSI